MNPCPCGHLGNPLKACICAPGQIARYQSRLSGPFLDRLDLMIEVPMLAPKELAGLPDGESSAVVAQRVAGARKIAMERQACCNARLSARQLEQYAQAEPAAMDFLQKAAAQLGLSARGYHRLLRVARSIADLEPSKRIQLPHMAEAIQLRRGLMH
ncbi:ATP-binding protein [Paucibacter sp. Y2R2-4]|uniref:magnesium chelatase subunit ChlI family protein n=1 Tax=Paucibacter sp. Y2R2-4 TaxID=2893553 RepID=UPI0021E515FA|nr:ATP-binding protein [Paucibacter sp. Y2R2-4]MCV2350797.1 ATP-binding protein [Paucibacter sp. Y2R2-4]